MDLPALTVSQLIDRLIELRDAGCGEAKVLYPNYEYGDHEEIDSVRLDLECGGVILS